MPNFEVDALVMRLVAADKTWRVVVTAIYTPSASELTANRRHNDVHADFEPHHQQSTTPQVDLLAVTEDTSFEMWWLPCEKVLGPHVSVQGWTRPAFNRLKQELVRWGLREHPAASP